MDVVLDTNVWVAAGFNPDSSAAQIIQAIRDGDLRLVWNQATRRETRAILTRIPPLDWDRFAGLFTPDTEYTGPTSPDDFSIISDPDDRKFAALAAASGAILVSNDEHLLAVRSQLDITVDSSRELMDRRGR